MWPRRGGVLQTIESDGGLNINKYLKIRFAQKKTVYVKRNINFKTHMAGHGYKKKKLENNFVIVECYNWVLYVYILGIEERYIKVLFMGKCVAFVDLQVEFRV